MSHLQQEMLVSTVQQAIRRPFASNTCKSFTRTALRCFSYSRRQWVDSRGENSDSQHDNGTWRRSGFSQKALVLVAGTAASYIAASWYHGRNKDLSTGATDGFIKYTLTGREDVSSTCSTFTFRPSKDSHSIEANEPDWKRSITSIQFKQPQLQIARSYTPLPPVPGHDPSELRFLVRKEQKGEVSGYLHRLAAGAEVELRGPSAEYVLPDRVDQVVFIVGGTGIAPAMQVLDILRDETDVQLLWANRKREDCVGGTSSTKVKGVSNWDFSGWWSPFGLPSADSGKKDVTSNTHTNAVVSQLNALRQRGRRRSTTDYFVDEEGSFIRPADVARLIKPTSQLSAMDQPGTKLLFVSGPEGFVTYWGGPKQWANGREVQGQLGGLLAGLDLRGWTVIKL